MDDFERYGDYNDTDEPIRPSRAPLILKIISISLIAVIVLTVGIRMFIFDYYPPEMSQLYFNDILASYYNSTSEFKPTTQKLRAAYDNPDEGNFFADKLILIQEIGQLQVCMRYNISVADTLVAKYGLAEFDPENTDQFSFRLWRSDGGAGYETGSLSYSDNASFAMYRYTKLVFDGVDFDGAEWIRLEIFVDGIDKPFMIAIYENNDSYDRFDEYKVTKGERP